MPVARPTPFDAVFGAIAGERFPPLRAALAAEGRDPRDRDGFLLVREVVELLLELRPDEGLGAAVEALAAFVHHAYLYWMDGAQVGAVSQEELEQILAEGRTGGQADSEATPDGPPLRPSACPSVSPSSYVQLPPLRIWGTPVAGAPPEPLDGWFRSRHDDRLSVLAVFGLNPARAGLTAVEAAGPRPGPLGREDGSPRFAPLLEGGAAAGLHSVAGVEELLELAWRVESGLVPGAVPAPSGPPASPP
jgi:hypothetical protein